MVVAEPILETAFRLLKEYPLCDSCLGRQFAMLGTGLTNKERGRCLKMALLMSVQAIEESNAEQIKDYLRILARSDFAPASLLIEKLGEKPPKPEPCHICGGLMSRLDEYARNAAEKVSSYDFSTMLVGCRVPDGMVAKEDELRYRYDLKYGESIKREINREVGKLLESMLKAVFSPRNPEMTILIDLIRDEVEVLPAPLFIYGRYRKLARGIPQNPWVVWRRGKVERKYPTSVAELIAKPILKETGGSGFKFHGAGREDVDVRMLGNGRPFILEILFPRKRKVDLNRLQALVNEHSKGIIEVKYLFSFNFGCFF